jgi:hypothetical protein
LIADTDLTDEKIAFEISSMQSIVTTMLMELVFKESERFTAILYQTAVSAYTSGITSRVKLNRGIPTSATITSSAIRTWFSTHVLASKANIIQKSGLLPDHIHRFNINELIRANHTAEFSVDEASDKCLEDVTLRDYSTLYTACYCRFGESAQFAMDLIVKLKTALSDGRLARFKIIDGSIEDTMTDSFVYVANDFYPTYANIKNIPHSLSHHIYQDMTYGLFNRLTGSSTVIGKLIFKLIELCFSSGFSNPVLIVETFDSMLHLPFFSLPTLQPKKVDIKGNVTDEPLFKDATTIIEASKNMQHLELLLLMHINMEVDMCYVSVRDGDDFNYDISLHSANMLLNQHSLNLLAAITSNVSGKYHTSIQRLPNVQQFGVAKRIIDKEWDISNIYNMRETIFVNYLSVNTVGHMRKQRQVMHAKLEPMFKSGEPAKFMAKLHEMQKVEAAVKKKKDKAAKNMDRVLDLEEQHEVVNDALRKRNIDVNSATLSHLELAAKIKQLAKVHINGVKYVKFEQNLFNLEEVLEQLGDMECIASHIPEVKLEYFRKKYDEPGTFSNLLYIQDRLANGNSK